MSQTSSLTNARTIPNNIQKETKEDGKNPTYGASKGDLVMANENDKVVEHKVTISDDGKYAIFTTNHFSIYTLASTGEKTTESTVATPIAATNKDNPATGDNILTYITLLIISCLGLTTLVIKRYKKSTI